VRELEAETPAWYVKSLHARTSGSGMNAAVILAKTFPVDSPELAVPWKYHAHTLRGVPAILFLYSFPHWLRGAWRPAGLCPVPLSATIAPLSCSTANTLTTPSDGQIAKSCPVSKQRHLMEVTSAYQRPHRTTSDGG
jgi:hypothetical protein